MSFFTLAHNSEQQQKKLCKDATTLHITFCTWWYNSICAKANHVDDTPFLSLSVKVSRMQTISHIHTRTYTPPHTHTQNTLLWPEREDVWVEVGAVTTGWKIDFCLWTSFASQISGFISTDWAWHQYNFHTALAAAEQGGGVRTQGQLCKAATSPDPHPSQAWNVSTAIPNLPPVVLVFSLWPQFSAFLSGSMTPSCPHFLHALTLSKPATPKSQWSSLSIRKDSSHTDQWGTVGETVTRMPGFSFQLWRKEVHKKKGPRATSYC